MSHSEKNLSKREEEYLEAIYIILKRKGNVRVKDLARLLNIKSSSVVEFLEKLSKKGLVNYTKHESITLTSEGLSIAKEIYRRHVAIKEFLTTILNIPEEIAEKDSCYIEHGIHELTLDRMLKFVEFIKKCPRGLPRFLENLYHYYRHGACLTCCSSQICVRKLR
ncbi:MAG: iron-dependent repressor [Thermoprotei archaeon ex4572_64]|nr:MAG: iron-dependent repressor [Thermoprotei archaeon ex4572_64]